MEGIQIFLMIFLGILAILAPITYKQLDKDKSRNEMIKSLLMEIEINNDILKKGLEHFPHYRFKGFWHSLRINRVSSAVSSEEIDSLSSETQELLSEYHEKAQRMNECVKKLESEQDILVGQKVLSEQGPRLRAQNLLAEQNPLLNRLMEISPILKSLLESELG